MPSTGVLMRLLEIRGDNQSTDEVILQPGVTANWLRFLRTRAEHRARAIGGAIEIASGKAGTFSPTTRTDMAVGRAHMVDPGQWHRLSNTSKEPVTFHITLKPSWNPQRAMFRLEDRIFRGDEVWFEVKTHIGDRSNRAMYMLHQLGARRGNVSVRLDPGTESIECFHRKAAVTITGVSGIGTLRIDGAPRQLSPRNRVVVKPGQRYHLRNARKQPFQANQIHVPQWEPDDTFYVTGQHVIPGDQAWFEFVVPN